MALIIKEIKLEVSKPNLIQAVVAKQNDCNSRYLKASLWDEGVQLSINPAAEVTINAERKDGLSDSFYGEVNNDNTVTVPLHSWMLELDGSVNCDVSIIVDERKLTTTSFVVMVEKAACNSDSISTNPQHDVLVDLINDVNETKKGVANAIKGKASGNPVSISDGSPISHEIKVKLGGSFSQEMVFDSAKEDGSQLDSTISTSGFYTVESASYNIDGDTTLITFTDGNTVSMIYIEGEPFAEGDLVYVEVNGEDQRFTVYRGATVQKYGLNLFDQETFLRKNGFVKQADGSWFGQSVSATAFKPPVEMKGSMYLQITAKSAASKVVFYFRVYYTDGSDSGSCCILLKEHTDWTTLDFVTDPNKTVKSIGWSYSSVGNFYVKEVLIAYDKSAYEPYNGHETLTADENGNLSILGNGESMTLIAEDGVTMDVEYNADTKKYIDNKFAELAAMIVSQ